MLRFNIVAFSRKSVRPIIFSVQPICGFVFSKIVQARGQIWDLLFFVCILSHCSALRPLGNCAPFDHVHFMTTTSWTCCLEKRTTCNPPKSILLCHGISYTKRCTTLPWSALSAMPLMPTIPTMPPIPLILPMPPMPTIPPMPTMPPPCYGILWNFISPKAYY